MPIIPTLEPRSRTPLPQVPVHYGGEEDDALTRIQRALALDDRLSADYDESQATKIAGEYGARLKGELELAKERYGNPDEFVTNATQITEANINAARQSTENQRQLQKVET